MGVLDAKIERPTTPPTAIMGGCCTRHSQAKASTCSKLVYPWGTNTTVHPLLGQFYDSRYRMVCLPKMSPFRYRSTLVLPQQTTPVISLPSDHWRSSSPALTNHPSYLCSLHFLTRTQPILHYHNFCTAMNGTLKYEYNTTNHVWMEKKIKTKASPKTGLTTQLMAMWDQGYKQEVSMVVKYDVLNLRKLKKSSERQDTGI